MRIKSKCLTSFACDESGATAVIVALLLTVLLGFVALGVDVAYLYRERAALQSDSDLTAMSSVADTERAALRAEHALIQNRRGADTLVTLQTGRFLRNPALPKEERFIPLEEGSAGINAVSVLLSDAAPLHFAKIFSDKSNVMLSRSSTATKTGAASFALTSNIARLGQDSLNDALSQSFSTTIELSAGDINVLAESTLNLGDLLATLARQAGNTSRNPAAVLNDQTSPSAVIAALQTLLPPGAATRLNNIAAAAGEGPIDVAALVGGIDSALGLTATEFASQVDLSALDVVNAIARSNGLSLDLNVNADVAGVISNSTQLVTGEPTAHSGWIALGEEGAQLNRAAARLLSDVTFAPDVLGTLGVGISVTRVNLPIFVEVAGATATLEEISCKAADLSEVAARFSTAPTQLHPQNGTSVAALYLGTLEDADFTTGPIDPDAIGYADILDLTLRVDLPLLPDIVIAGITVQARSTVALGESQVEELRFSGEEIRAGDTTKYFGSGELLSSGISDLLSPATMQIRLKPGQQGLITGLASPLLETALAVLPVQLLDSLTAPLDQTIDAALDLTGISLGEGELTLTGHHCEQVRLVR